MRWPKGPTISGGERGGEAGAHHCAHLSSTKRGSGEGQDPGRHLPAVRSRVRGNPLCLRFLICKERTTCNC